MIKGYYKKSVNEKDTGSKQDYLSVKADKLRADSLIATTVAGSGHPTSCLSCADIMSCLFFSELKEGDEFILSKGHAAPILWSVYAECGLISKEDLESLRKFNSITEGHPTPRAPGIRIATGSLGQGLSSGVGIALSKRILGKNERVYVLLGDGECAEGAVWEAAACASHYQLGNLCAIIDVNRLGQTGETMHGWDLGAYRSKFESFGWQTIEINGNHIHDILDAFEKAKESKKPFVILAKTVKGKGVSFLEDKEGWHGKPLSREELAKALKELGSEDVVLSSGYKIRENPKERHINNFDFTPYKIDDMVSTREAFGKAILSLGKKNKIIIGIDGDVKNSTKMEDFFKAFPERSFQGYIAEQNMVGMAAGFSSQGFVPFVSTFSAFLTRAHDFIRMASYSWANIKFIGSHSGVSIGEDGASQMGLEDIGMFLSIQGSIVLYPCDAVSAEHLILEIAKHQGISYLRTTREKTPVVYKNGEDFPIGGLKVLAKSSKDKALIIGAGITLHEALKAHSLLQKKKINIRVIDLYSIKPVDAKGIIKNAKECKNKIIVVEDHYSGGIGTVVADILITSSQKYSYKHLHVNEIPKSGKPEELLKASGIDAEAIVNAVKKLI